MQTQVSYEWTVEEIDEFGDANAVHFLETLSDACELRDQVRSGCHRVNVGLVRHEGNNLDGETARYYAYFNDAGRLPEVFSSCSDERDGPRVPRVFRLKTPTAPAEAA